MKAIKQKMHLSPSGLATFDISDILYSGPKSRHATKSHGSTSGTAAPAARWKTKVTAATKSHSTGSKTQWPKPCAQCAESMIKKQSAYTVEKQNPMGTPLS